MLDCPDPWMASRIAVLWSFCNSDEAGLRGIWRDVEGVDPQGTNNKLETYQALFALPFDHNVRKSIRLPWLLASGFLCLGRKGVLLCAIGAHADKFKMRSMSFSCIGTRGQYHHGSMILRAQRQEH
eukprot:1145407-Pelagomonas_calceolata.AAC.2